ncbi:hypothetical protein CYMTET_29214, partial [Cymbomonas tetramitiformis]
ALEAHHSQPDIAVPDLMSAAFHRGGRAPPRADPAERPPAAGCRHSHMFGVVSEGGRHRPALLTGFLTQQLQFGSTVWNTAARMLKLHCDCDGVLLQADPRKTFSTEWAVLHPMAEAGVEPLTPYLEAVAQANESRVAGPAPLPVPTGWNSWYHFFHLVSEKAMEDNLVQLAQYRTNLPVRVVQLDDGYAEAWGDWTTLNARFTQSLTVLAARIASEGYLPGLWMAPIAADKHAAVIRDHPDWILRRTRGGVPVNSGFTHPGKWFYALDITHPEVQEHVRLAIHTAVHVWGFRYLKCDFLYCAALPGARHDPRVTRAQAMQLALRIIREAAGSGVFILGCSCPLGSAVGWVDGMRVSADAGLSWKPEFPLPHWDKMNLPAARNAVRNSVTRASIHGRWWWNDPDCVLLRETTNLTRHELQAVLTVVALTGGAVFISDDLKVLGGARMRMLEVLLPPTHRAATALDLLLSEEPEVLTLELSGAAGTWTLLALCNWSDRPAACKLAPADIRHLASHEAFRGQSEDATGAVEVHALDFWGAEYFATRLCSAGRAAGEAGTPGPPSILLNPQGQPPRVLPPHSAQLFALRASTAGRASYLGSDVHFSCGMEVSKWEDSVGHDGGASCLSAHFNLAGRSTEGRVWLHLPPSSHQSGQEAAEIAVTGNAYAGMKKQVAPMVWIVHISLRDTGALHVKY